MAPNGGPDPNQPIPEEPDGQISLRTALSKAFPIAVKTRRSTNGKVVVMPLLECSKAFARLQRHAVAYKNLHQWGTQRPRDSRTPSAAVTFWYSAEGGGAGPSGAGPSAQGGGAGPSFPDVAFSGLKSAAARLDVVELLCYQRSVSEHVLRHLPSIVVLDASEYLILEDFNQQFKNGVGVRLLAAIVRARRLLRRGGGWFVDCDTLWLRPIGPLMLVPPQFGHFVASMRKPGNVARLPADELTLKQEVEYLAAPQDRAWIASPFAFPPDSPVLAEIVATFEAKIQPVCFMEQVQRCVRAHGLEYAYVKPEVCSPLPRWLTRDRLLIKRATTVDLEAMQKSVCVNAFWSGSLEFDKNSDLSAERVTAAGSLANVNVDSVWAHVLRLAGQKLEATEATRPPKRRITGKRRPYSQSAKQRKVEPKADPGGTGPDKCGSGGADPNGSLADPANVAVEAKAPANVAVKAQAPAKVAVEGLQQAPAAEALSDRGTGPSDGGIGPNTRQLQAVNWPAIPCILESPGPRMLTVEEFRCRYELLGAIGKGAFWRNFGCALRDFW